jgi:hypothetical protein
MTLEFPGCPVENANVFAAKSSGAHALFHGQRHWAQLATLVRAAGFPSGFRGDLLLSSALARQRRRKLRPALLLLKAGAAQHRPALGRLEGHRRLSPHSEQVVRVSGRTLEPAANALGLALLAVLGVVLELFVVEEKLLAGGEHELGAAIDALQYSDR